MKSLVRRRFAPLISLVTGWPVSVPDADAPGPRQPTPSDEPPAQRQAVDAEPSRLSPGAEDAQAAHVRRQLAHDAVQQALARHPAVRRQRAERQAARREGQLADGGGQPTVGGTRQARAWYERDDDRDRREAELEARRARQARRAAEASASGQDESRISAEALETQAALVREQLERDVESRAQARPTRRPLRNRTRMGPLQRRVRLKARMPGRDVRVDDLVTAGIVTSAIAIGALTRLADGAWLIATLAAAAALPVFVLVIDYRRWHGSFPARITRIGAVAGLVFFLGFTFIGRVGELAPIPLPDDCSIDQLRAHYANQRSNDPRAEYWRRSGIERLTGRLRRPAVLESDSERASIFVSRGLRRLRLGDPEQALADFQRGLELDPDQSSAHLLRAELFEAADCPQHAHADRAAVQRIFASSDIRQALAAAVRQLHALAPTLNRPPQSGDVSDVLGSSFGMNMTQGIALAQLRRWPEAIERLTHASQQDPRDANSRFFRGLIHRRLGDVPAALADFKTAADLRPYWAAPRAAVGYALVGQGRVLTGMAALNAAVESDSSSWLARQWRGQALLVAGEAEAAHGDFVQAIRIQTDASIGLDFADSYVGLAAAELALGDHHHAGLVLAEARSRPPSWINEPSILALLSDVERALPAP